MSETPRTGDRVRVTFEGVVADLDDHGRVATAYLDGQERAQYVAAPATVEVLERADDPTIGEIRAVAPSADGTPKTAVKVGSRLSTNPGERCMWVIVETGEMLADGDVSGLGVVVGAVPDSPAAKAQQPARLSVRVPNEPHGLPTSARPNVALLVRAGDITGAVKAVRAATYWPLHEARSYVEDMEEYQAYLSEHGEETRTLHVHPHVWKPLVSYLAGIAVEVFEISGADDERRAYAMKPNDGEWVQ